MADPSANRLANAPSVYSIAAHRGFADALVAGLVPRYANDDFGLARLTLLLPSRRTMRTVSEAFIRHFGEGGRAGMLMPRMTVVGDLDLDETLGSLLDPLGAADIPRSVDPTRRWLRLSQLLEQELGKDAPRGSALMRLARDVGTAMDRLLVEDVKPEALVQDSVLDLLGDLSRHWLKSLSTFIKVQHLWLSELQASAEVDAATRRNRLFDFAAERWRAQTPDAPIVAAGVTSAAPALARLLRVVADLPNGAVILPDLDLAMDETVWTELGTAGAPQTVGDPPFAAGDAVTHPQYHLKLLLNRMGIARAEVRPWHRKGLGAAPPERSHAISSLFLPPEASKGWADLPADKRRLAGVRLMESATPEEEAQAIALLIREALDTAERRIAVVTPDRSLARRVAQHLQRWNIAADDSAGQPLSDSAAGRMVLLLAEIMSGAAAPVPLIAALQHPLVQQDSDRGKWLAQVRALEIALRGPRPAPGFAAMRPIAANAGLIDWWDRVEEILSPLLVDEAEHSFADLLDLLIQGAEMLCGEAVWSREDGRALANTLEDLRFHARNVGAKLAPADLHSVLMDVFEKTAVRPPYGGHPRVAIYGLLESRMSRADLVICAGLNEGSWPAAPGNDPLLAPPVLRALGVPGADFRIGLSAHDLAGALGAPDVILSRARRDISGPALASRFLLRVRALLGADLAERHQEETAIDLAQVIDLAEKSPPYERPSPKPSADQRKVDISVTALDCLRSDPYQFYASHIMHLRELDGLDAEPSPAWQGTAAHEILEEWHKSGRPMELITSEVLTQMSAHPLTRALWQPRLMKGLDWVESTVFACAGRVPVSFEAQGKMEIRGIKITGKADRIDRLEGGGLAIVDYKTGSPPSGKEVEQGFALQLGMLGMMAERSCFNDRSGIPLAGEVQRFEYWSLGKSEESSTGFGYVTTPVLERRKTTGIKAEDFLPQTEIYLHQALDQWILGTEGFTARLNPDAKNYNTYDQLMRLDEWQGREA